MTCEGPLITLSYHSPRYAILSSTGCAYGDSAAGSHINERYAINSTFHRGAVPWYNSLLRCGKECPSQPSMTGFYKSLGRKSYWYAYTQGTQTLRCGRNFFIVLASIIPLYTWLMALRSMLSLAVAEKSGCSLFIPGELNIHRGASTLLATITIF